MTPQERHALIQQAMQAFNPHYRESIQQVFAEANIKAKIGFSRIWRLDWSRNR